MGLDLSKLEKVKYHGSKVIARCPACAENGNDHKSEHLFIEPGGRFGCVVFPGNEGRKHRQRIFELAGAKENTQDGFKVKKSLPSIVSEQEAIQKNILGRLGHFKSTHARKAIEKPVLQKEKRDESLNSVPAVPETNLYLYSPNEQEILHGVDTESLQRIDEVKRLFNGMVVSVLDRKP